MVGLTYGIDVGEYMVLDPQLPESCRPCGKIHNARELTNCTCLRLEDNDLATTDYFRCAPRMARILPRCSIFFVGVFSES